MPNRLRSNARLAATWDLSERVDVPEWAAGLSIGDSVELHSDRRDVTFTATVIGFSTTDDHAGQPVVRGGDVPWMQGSMPVIVDEHNLRGGPDG